MRNIILASKSKDRKKLLERIGITFKIIISDVKEEKFKKEITNSSKLVQKLAKAKALNVKEKVNSQNMDSYVIIAADTIVEFRGKLIGKADNEEQAFNTLKMLSGKTHNLITGIAITNGAVPCITDFDKTKVKFNKLTDNEIWNYIKTNEWKGRAGCYSLNEKASLFTEEIIGSPSNVIGLPMHKIYKILKNEFNLNLMNNKIIET
ncbi:MAG: Maf-like protein [Promethearchaeota archaeon]|nr:MAG: Maf-like protein [Candidatus Lokiarchaeota archaeon]